MSIDAARASRFELAEAVAISAIASGSRHHTMSTISHRIVRSPSDRQR
jgi:hypothetical protein